MTKPNNDSLDELPKYIWGFLTRFKLAVTHREKPFGQIRADYNKELQAYIKATHRPISEIEAAIPKKKAETEKELESLDVVERYEYLNYPCFSRYDMDSEHDRAVDQIRKALGISAEKGKE